MFILFFLIINNLIEITTALPTILNPSFETLESDDYFLDEVYEGPLEEPIIVEYEYDLNQFNKYLKRKKIQLKQ